MNPYHHRRLTREGEGQHSTSPVTVSSRRELKSSHTSTMFLILSMALFVRYHKHVSDSTFNSRIDGFFVLFLIIFSVEVIRTGVVMPLKDNTATPLIEQRQQSQQYLTTLSDSSDKSSKQNPAYTTNELLSKMKHYTQTVVDVDGDKKNGETTIMSSIGGDGDGDVGKFNIRHMLNQEARQQRHNQQQQIRRTPQDIMNVLGRYCQHDSTLC